MTGFLIVVGGVLALAWGHFVIAGEVAADPRRPQARSGARRCPYCHGPAGGEPQRCPACATQHHRGCWEEQGGCSVFGCVAAGPVVQRTQPLEPVAANPEEAAEDEGEDPEPLPGAEWASEVLQQRRVVKTTAG